MKTAADGSAEAKQATIQLCSVRAGAGLYGIDTRAIREVLGNSAPQRVPLAPAHIAGVLTYRGEVLEAISLRTLLGLSARPGAARVLVLEDSELGERFGLMVDEVGGVVSIAEEAMEKNPVTLDARSEAIFDGVFQMKDGLMVRLNAQRLRPLELARSGLFGAGSRAGLGGAE
jgi:purine-binding chemotaxis protein CheW